MELGRTLEGRRIVIVAGAGGVGKTTVSAALAVALAEAGERVCVITIDPARRLADALGVELSGEPRRVPITGSRGSLDALMLDVKGTFDALVERYAPTPQQRDAIFRNRVYRSLSSSTAGAQEYMAVERLCELSELGRYDRIVLDTPPSANALDFLDAPARLVRFLEGRSLRMFLRPSMRAGRVGLRLAGRGANLAMLALERVTGVALLRDVSDFFLTFEGMLDGFHDRAEVVAKLLASEQTTFLLVATAADEALDEAVLFRDALATRGLRCGGLVANRMARLPLVADAVAASADIARIGEAALVASGLAEDVAARAGAALADAQRRATEQRAQLAAFAETTGLAPLASLPLLEVDVNDVERLSELARWLGLTGRAP
jgi:anion-transporting  ArsA/GET3 family ATPase